ncbi:hypothetical protein LTR78_000399 [Recurvomyces mirabilis]|uniref:Uncharacterized protein n=1 Tax=Recurvomyces mirabilis TaxID=574656 RepID=A0AAE0WX68_9PEZI|nr:hypothetical protein LTR78_000399 [Recurvomyces mirabilis]KAK5162054.1 hypothetical protein LTS14_000400 [Recurvomyces mirabilis]
MSLNGLDAQDVEEAYKNAMAEAGGWFLLKYTSRDSVALLGRGKAGVHEARVALAKYEEASPLYGLIIYRRRKVLIKYIPDGTSRLLQERYSPYETLLEITTPESLNDTSLAASFPLHTASPSTSSNRLHEISEDGEDHGPRPTTKQTFSSTGSIFGTQRYKSEKRVDQLMTGQTNRRTTPSIRVTDDPTSLPAATVPTTQKASISQFLVREESGQRSITSLSSQPSITSSAGYASSDDSSKTVETLATTHEPQALRANERSDPNVGRNDFVNRSYAPASTSRDLHTGTVPNRPLDRPSVSERQGISEATNRKLDDDPYDLSKFDFMKPKVKLGPRPVAPGERNKRTTVSGTAAIPSNFRPAQKKSEPSQPVLQTPAKIAPQYTLQDLPAPPPIPNLPEYTPRPVSRGSIKSLPSHKSVGMTNDKLRLMKAVELRKKQLRKSNPQPASFVPPPDEEAPAVPTLPAQSRAPMETYQPTGRTQYATNQALAALEEAQHTKKADSGIEMKYSHTDEQPEAKQDFEPAPNEVRPATPPRHGVEEEPQKADQMKAVHAVTRALTPPASLGAPGEALPDRNAEEVQSVLQSSTPSEAVIDAVSMHQEPRAEDHTLEQSRTAESTQDFMTVRPPSSEYADTVVAEPIFSLDMLDDGPQHASNTHEMPLQHTEANLLGAPTTNNSSSMDVPSIVVKAGTRPVTPASDNAQPSRRGSLENDLSSPPANMSGSGTLEPANMSPRRNNTDLARRRRGIVEPLHLTSHGDGDFASDDELMEELQSATFQDATTMTMARSPHGLSFPRHPSESTLSESVRSVKIRRSSSNLLDPFEAGSDRASPVPQISSPWRKHASSTPELERADPLQGLRRNVSTGITKRIQALAEVSSREVSPNPPARSPTPEQLPTTAWRERKTSVRSPPRSRTTSMQKLARQSKRLSGNMISRENSSEATPTWSVQPDPTGNRNSVSVSARIVRTRSETEREEVPSGDTPLQPSELHINRQRTSQPQVNKSLPPLNTDATNPNWDLTPAFGHEAPQAPGRGSSDYRSLHSAHRKSLGRYRQNMSPMTPSAEDFPPPPMQGNMQKAASRASTASSNDDNAAAARDGSRTSRFFKRMSNFGGKDKRRSGVQQFGGSTNGGGAVESPPTSAPRSNSQQQDRSDMPPPVVVGDLNVQFPDSLLWKRRIVSIDSAGYLVFAIPQAMDIHKGTSKRFHLSELKQPYAPDLDRQELPHSVMLDFGDGQTTLQAACGDAMTHRQVLHVLRGYWRSWGGA